MLNDSHLLSFQRRLESRDMTLRKLDSCLRRNDKCGALQAYRSKYLWGEDMDKFEEYKLFVEDTARFTDRRQTVNNIYVAVNSIVLTAVTFLVKVAGPFSLWRAFTAMPVLAAGIFVCLQWDQLLYKYKQLMRLRFRELRAMEDEVDGSHQMYHKEDELYPRDEEGEVIRGEGLNNSDRERWLPRVFIVVYVLFFLGSLTLLIYTLNQ